MKGRNSMNTITALGGWRSCFACRLHANLGASAAAAPLHQISETHSNVRKVAPLDVECIAA
jgi:hypothetical protein